MPNHESLKNRCYTFATSSSNTQLIYVFVVISLFCISFLGIQHDAFAQTNSAGVIIPLYSYLGSDWDQLIKEKNAHPSVPMLAVINPNNGPGGSFDSNYLNGVQKLQSAGIVVLGYVYTSYGSRSTGSISADIDTYKNWYHPNGIAFDEMANVHGFESYYSNLNNYAKSQGFTLTVANPGTDTLSSYIGTVDNLVIYEHSSLPNITSLGGWHEKFDKNNFSVISYGINYFNKTFVKELSNHVGYLYITDKNLPNHFNSLPIYFDDMVKTLENTQQQSPSSSSVPLSMTIKSTDLKSNPISGLWVAVLSNGIPIKTGFTPFSFTVPSSNQYAIVASDYKSTIFNHWNDGGTNATKIIVPTQNASLIAYYSTEAVQLPLTVKSVDLLGNPITGLRTTIQSGSTILTAGYTPLTYAVTADNQYTVTIENYQTSVFNHWDDGSMNSSKIITPKQNSTLTAYYNNTKSAQVLLLEPVGFSNFNYTYGGGKHYMVVTGQYTNGDTPYSVIFIAVNFYEKNRLVSIAHGYLVDMDKHEKRSFNAILRDPQNFDSYTLEVKSTFSKK